MQHRLTPATRMGLSISIATGLYGISFGALSVAAGFSLPQTLALSLLMFTGGSQFAYVAVAAGGVAAFRHLPRLVYWGCAMPCMRYS